MANTPTGPVTRSRAKAMQDKVNPLLSLHQFDLSMDGLLPQADVLCVLRYEPDVDLSTGQGVKGGEGPDDGDREDDEQVATGEVPGNSSTTGRDAVLPATRYYRPTSGQLPGFASVRGPAVTRK